MTITCLSFAAIALSISSRYYVFNNSSFYERDVSNAKCLYTGCNKFYIGQ